MKNLMTPINISATVKVVLYLRKPIRKVMIMEKKVMIYGVKIVEGHEINEGWSGDMTIVETNVGEFVAHLWTAKTWGSWIGDDVDVKIEVCKASPTWTWIKWKDGQDD